MNLIKLSIITTLAAVARAEAHSSAMGSLRGPIQLVELEAAISSDTVAGAKEESGDAAIEAGTCGDITAKCTKVGVQDTCCVGKTFFVFDTYYNL